MNPSIDVPHWRTFYDDGCKYLRSAAGGRKRAAVFTPEITCNLADMAIEKMAMALLVEAGDMADNHTMHDLVISLSRLPELDLDLLEALDGLGRFEDLCPMAPAKHSAATAEDIPSILTIAQRLQDAAKERLPL